ncbi:MAG: restriction endonuclease subunit R [Epsilonproteobacteria bacterium]|nr:MAG: restriction endonuclease subunit R [Campylobacterota bacterium]
MNIKFKTQDYQTNAVNSIVDCFEGQVKSSGIKYRVDPGTIKEEHQRQSSIEEFEVPEGVKNADFTLTANQILENIQDVQQSQNLPISDELKATSVSKVNLEIEMETGTGKTYVYIKTMLELNEKYGWNKFIIVVPSIAIREGVYQTFELTREHFKEQYSKEIRPFIYNSKSLHEIESYSTDANINVMIINVQAFNARGADARKIFRELDSFGSRRPIDMIKSNRPILIIDEPQKIDGDLKKESKSYKSLIEFNPLMILSYSATHKKIRNKVHRLDALDAYNQKLVKKISVRGISVKGLSGNSAYTYLQDIEVSKSKPPIAKLEIEIKQKSSISKKMRNVIVGDNLYDMSEQLEQYKNNYVVSEIDPITNKLTFANGDICDCGVANGDVNEDTLRRLQIKETIKIHLEKEQVLFQKGIKVLSLFFIDEVAKYRVYSEDETSHGEYAQYFEDEYKNAINELGTVLTPEYQKYLNDIDVKDTHNGYFSKDKKGKMVDSKIKSTGEMKGQSDDIDAYDLILKDKKRLLSFQEPTRFIFSHSALREGWDNPNVFVICTLKHSDNTISRRQEVGRGMRISVDMHGNRMDNPATVHQTNILTVVANESYKDFVTGLQQDISETLSSRPIQANEEYFHGKVLDTKDGKIKVDDKMARAIYKYLLKNDYIDDDDQISDEYHQAKKDETLAKLPTELEDMTKEIIALVDTVFSAKSLEGMIGNDREEKINPLNDNFSKKEFQELWANINKKAIYTVHYNSKELIINCVGVLDNELKVNKLKYVVEAGEQNTSISYNDMKNNDGFSITENETHYGKNVIKSTVKYDLIGKITESTKLTRATVGQILKRISEKTFNQYKINPEDFIQRVSTLINEQKATTVINHLTYDKISEEYSSDIFMDEKPKESFSKAMKMDKHIYDYVFTDSNIEKKFATNLDTSKEVIVYAKLPRSFFIPTPVGDYNPDWAIAFEKDKVKHIYFIAETKGDMSSMQLRDIEKIKIECARRFFKEISNEKVVYDKVDSYDTLLRLVQ